MTKQWDALGGGRWLAFLLAFTCSSAGAQTLTIEHQPVSCAVADRFPRLEAHIQPSENVAQARVIFQGANRQEWYSVDMTLAGGLCSGVLPKPRPSLKAFTYYVEVTGVALGTSRTPEYTAAVVEGSTLCQGKVAAGVLASASVLLHGPVGVVALPAGFASSGVTLAGGVAVSSTGAAGAAGAGAGGGGGLSGAALAGIVAGTGAVAGGVVLVAGKGGDDEATGTTYSGSISGQYTVTQVAVGNETTTCAFARALSGTMRITLSSSTSQAQIDVNEDSGGVSGGCAESGPGCCGPSAFMCAFTGGSGSLSCADQRTTASGGAANTQSIAFTGSLSSGVISGMLTYGRNGQSTTNGVSASHSGSTTFPITLR